MGTAQHVGGGAIPGQGGPGLSKKQAGGTGHEEQPGGSTLIGLCISSSLEFSSVNGCSWKIKINPFLPSCFWLLFYHGNKWPTRLNTFGWERLGPQMSEGRAVRLTSCPYTQGALHVALSPFTQLRLVDHNAPGTCGWCARGHPSTGGTQGQTCCWPSMAPQIPITQQTRTEPEAPEFDSPKTVKAIDSHGTVVGPASRKRQQAGDFGTKDYRP